MFYSSSNLNEGQCRKSCAAEKKRELYEGNNPKITEAGWQVGASNLHVNANWQNRRK
ncbi:hypothetical protein [Draconibacterium halophilum]|uniref:Uncharacterized protein n=1 Tax=Draconibacterium halophilum TaxID=2706887 RepID=A0A6C0RHL7_9BACT|nr:hypothetical protein [Draconibacterium halophilum]QIA09496.1 hypothetical protein G0Q07_18070 [Draconibacterium halophilum]